MCCYDGHTRPSEGNHLIHTTRTLHCAVLCGSLQHQAMRYDAKPHCVVHYDVMLGDNQLIVVRKKRRKKRK